MAYQELFKGKLHFTVVTLSIFSELVDYHLTYLDIH